MASSSEKDGIDITKALDILSVRASEQEDGVKVPGEPGCGCAVPPSAKSMGQTINLCGETNPKEEDRESSLELRARCEAQVLQKELNDKEKDLEQTRKARRQEIQLKLESSSVSELLTALMEAQSKRVSTYREYDR